MDNSYHDKNGVATFLLIGTDGLTIMNGKVDPLTHELLISDGTTGTDNGPVMSRHDGNNMHILMGTSRIDGKTPVPIYGINGVMLVNSM